MRTGFIAIVAAAALTVGTFAAPQPAKADPISAWWLVPAFLGGMWFTGVMVRPTYGATYGYYGQPYGATYGYQNCWTERRRIGGVIRTVQSCY